MFGTIGAGRALCNAGAASSIISGGSRVNVVAASAEIEIDVRFRTAAQAAQVDAALRRLRPCDPRCRLQWQGGMERPPFERSRQTVRLYRLAARAAALQRREPPPAGPPREALQLEYLAGCAAVAEALAVLAPPAEAEPSAAAASGQAMPGTALTMPGA